VECCGCRKDKQPAPEAKGQEGIRAKVQKQKEEPIYTGSSFTKTMVIMKTGFLSSFLDTSSFTLKASQVVESRSSYLTFSDQLDFLDRWGKQWENTLQPDLVRYFSYCERFAVGVYVFALNHNALELLYTLFVTLTDFHVDVYSVTCLERWVRGTLVSIFLLNEFN
jgi:hypothetical protein